MPGLEADLQARRRDPRVERKDKSRRSRPCARPERHAAGAPAVIQIERDSKYMYVTFEMD